MIVDAGAWLDAEGNLTALNFDQRRATLRAQLATGGIRIPAYTRQTAALDRLEAAGKRERYERAATEVMDAIGAQVKTVWRNDTLELASGEDPDKTLLKYRTERTFEDTRPAAERIEIQTPHGPSVTWRETGGTETFTRTVREKRRLLSRDIPELIRLLAETERLDGQALDLDGNPITPPGQPFNHAQYKAALLNDLRERQLAVDIDEQARIMAGNLLRRRISARTGEAAAIMRSAARNLPNDDTRSEDNGD